MFEKNNFLFFHSRDADSLCFTVFLMRQLIKGDSFWAPYVQRVIDKDFELAYQWSDDLLRELQNPTLMTNIKGYGKDSEKQWEKINNILQRSPELFPKDKYSRDTYYRIMKYVSTHAFGGSMPCPMMVPFGECFNHGNETELYLDLAFHGKEGEPWKTDTRKTAAEYKEVLKQKQIWNIRLPDDGMEDEIEEKEESSDEEEEGKDDDVLVTKINENYSWWSPQNPEIHCYIQSGSSVIPKDSHVYYAYGKRTNADLMLNFGFVLSPNKYDTYRIVVWNNLNPWHNLKDDLNVVLVKDELATRVGTDYPDLVCDPEDPAFKELEVTTRTIKLGWNHLPSRGTESDSFHRRLDDLHPQAADDALQGQGRRQAHGHRPDRY